MSNVTPVLLLGHSRPQKLEQLIKSLRESSPRVVLVSVDGPRKDNPHESELVKKCTDVVQLINWTARIETLFHTENLGIRRAIPNAVSWAISKYGKVIVLEDDIIVGPDFISFAEYQLQKYEFEPHVAHINGYNLVPPFIHNSQRAYRFSQYSSSYGWATWSRAWQDYDDSMTWARNASLKEIRTHCSNMFGALHWKTEFMNAYYERVDSWAIRWLASIWSKDKLCITPNTNLIFYDGFKGGTHTKFGRSWSQLPIEKYSETDPVQTHPIDRPDTAADSWTARNFNKEYALGAVTTIAASIVLRLMKSLTQKK